MSAVNVPEKNAETPDEVDMPGDAESSDEAETADDAGTADDAAPADDVPGGEEARPEDGGTSLYVRRGRTPTLGFWVALAIAVPALAALLSAPLFAFADIGGVLNYVLLAAVFVGLPLAAIAALVDSLKHRGSGSRRR
ncbi:hypothetical protein [Brachybacterium sp.]|uniref:hypothetical protein n=1 Tax=Brachybacterium sp. TaxID=1891286 RepID=UPI002ED0B9E2